MAMKLASVQIGSSWNTRLEDGCVVFTDGAGQNLTIKLNAEQIATITHTIREMMPNLYDEAAKAIAEGKAESMAIEYKK